MRRRSFLLASLAAAPLVSLGQGRIGKAGPLLVGADVALVDSGLARAFQQGFGRDTGLLTKIVRKPALPLLDALAAGELDAALANVPTAELDLERQGLVYDRRAIADGGFVVVGPRAYARSHAEAAEHRAGASAATLLRGLAERATAEPGSVVFVSAGDGSGGQVAEQAAWRAAGVAPLPPWYQTAAPTARLVDEVRARGAFAIVERGAWTTQSGGAIAVLVDGDAQMVEHVHAMRAFRSPHPAGKLFIAWIAGGHGRAIVARHRGYRAISR